jgi:protein gp37
MSKTTNIEWCDSTFNPWIGCTKVSPACDNCYAAVSTPSRTLGIKWGAGQPRHRTSEANWKQPLLWQKNHEAFFKEHGHRQRVFCSSLADVFDNDVDPQWRVDLFALIVKTPNLDWLLLTKRIGNAGKMIGESICKIKSEVPYGDPKHPVLCWANNIWIGATICNQSEADRDIPKLLAVPAAKLFLSIEPLLSEIEFSSVGSRADRIKQLGQKALNGIDWVIVGGNGESGKLPVLPMDTTKAA